MRAHKFLFLWEKNPATSLFSSQLSRNSLKIFKSYAFPLRCCSHSLLVLRKRVTSSSLITTNPSAVIFFPNNREPTFIQQTWERRESRLRYSIRQLVLQTKNMTLGSPKQLSSMIDSTSVYLPGRNTPVEIKIEPIQVERF